MENIRIFLDAIKQRNGITSDYALAKKLELPTQRISDYYKGKAAPDEFACLKIAQALDKPLNEVIAAVKMDTEKDEARREVWRKYYKRLGGVAASISLLVVMSVILIVTPSPANASTRHMTNSGEFVLCKITSNLLFK